VPPCHSEIWASALPVRASTASRANVNLNILFIELPGEATARLSTSPSFAGARTTVRQKARLPLRVVKSGSYPLTNPCPLLPERRSSPRQMALPKSANSGKVVVFKGHSGKQSFPGGMKRFTSALDLFPRPYGQSGSIDQTREIEAMRLTYSPLRLLHRLYNSILRPISISALEGILNRSMACAELRDMNENNAARHCDRGFRCLRLMRSLRSM
jgi:hypothetical protein